MKTGDLLDVTSESAAGLGREPRQSDTRVCAVTTKPSSPGPPRKSGPPPPLRPGRGPWATRRPLPRHAAHLPQLGRLASRSESSSQPHRLPSQLSAAAPAHAVRLPFRCDFRPGGSNGSAFSVGSGWIQAPGFEKLPLLGKPYGTP